MKRLFASLLVLLSLSIAATALAGEPMTVHFVVVKDGVPGVDYAKEIPALKDALCAIAGGYTEIGPTAGGALDDAGKPEHESNHTFIVAAPGNVADAISAYVEEHFKDKPFILAWPAEMSR
jgi:hypothetical protein